MTVQLTFHALYIFASEQIYNGLTVLDCSLKDDVRISDPSGSTTLKFIGNKGCMHSVRNIFHDQAHF